MTHLDDLLETACDDALDAAALERDEPGPGSVDEDDDGLGLDGPGDLGWDSSQDPAAWDAA